MKKNHYKNEMMLEQQKNNDKQTKFNAKNKLNSKNMTIHDACFYNNLDFFSQNTFSRKLLDIGGGEYNSSPLQFACYNSNYKIILFLLFNNVDVYFKNNNNITCLNIIYKNDDVLGLIIFEGILNSKFTVNINILKNYKNIRKYKYRNNLTRNKFHYNEIFYLLIYREVRYFFILYLILYYKKTKYTNLFFLFLIFYSVSIFDSRLKYLFILYYIILGILVLKKNKINNKHSEINYELLVDTILEDKFNTENFCFLCLNVNFNHCSICNVCVLNKNHHCIFLNKCITKDNLKIFYVFLFLIITNLTCLVILSENIVERIEYSLLALTIISII